MKEEFEPIKKMQEKQLSTNMSARTHKPAQPKYVYP